MAVEGPGALVPNVEKSSDQFIMPKGPFIYDFHKTDKNSEPPPSLRPTSACMYYSGRPLNSEGHSSLFWDITTRLAVYWLSYTNIQYLTHKTCLFFITLVPSGFPNLQYTIQNYAWKTNLQNTGRITIPRFILNNSTTSNNTFSLTFRWVIFLQYIVIVK